MDKAKEDLKAILDLLAEWRDENGIGYVSVTILKDGRGQAYTFDGQKSIVDVDPVRYTNRENEEVRR